jgi:hypothetical protein
LEPAGAALRNLYVFSWRRIHAACSEDHLAFTSIERAALDPSQFHQYLRKVSGVRRNAEYNAFICRGLLEARNGRPPEMGAPPSGQGGSEN